MVWTRPRIPKSWNLEFGAFKIKKSGFYCTNLRQNNSRKLWKVLFKHLSPINGPKMAIIISECVPMIFLWFSHICGHPNDKGFGSFSQKIAYLPWLFRLWEGPRLFRNYLLSVFNRKTFKHHGENIKAFVGHFWAFFMENMFK